MTVSTEPDVVRISILGGSRQLDVGLPTAVPIAALIPDVLAALRVATADAGDAAGWTLARIDGARLTPEDTLAQSGVLDGDLLLVRTDRPTARSPLVDDVAGGVATILARDREGWTAESSRTVGYGVSLLAAATAVPVGRWAGVTGDRPAVLVFAAVGAVLALAVAVSGTRLRLDPRTATVLTVGACAWAALAASLAVPDVPGGAQFALGSVAAGACAVIGYRVTGGAPAVHVAITTASIPAAVAGALTSAASMPVAEAAAVAAALGVLLVLSAPRLAIAVGRLPLPGVPTTPPSADLDESSPVDGVDALPLPGRDPLASIADLALGDLDALADRAAVAAATMTGLLAGAMAAVGVSTVVLASANGSAVAVAYCACTVAALAARGRTHTDRLQSAILVGGAGAIAPIAAAAVLFADGGPGPLAVFLTIAAFGFGALLMGTVAADVDYSPPAVRAAEIVEYTLLAALIPLLLWVLDVYRMVREL